MARNPDFFKGKTVAITGGGSGIGRSTAVIFAREGARVIIGDINASMLSVGRDRLNDKGLVRGLQYVQLNAESLPFPDNSFDMN